MGDDEKDVHEADLQFENTDAGASTTYPNEAGKVRKGGHLVIRGRPCKVRTPCRWFQITRLFVRCELRGTQSSRSRTVLVAGEAESVTALLSLAAGPMLFTQMASSI
jgi:hypothetical protein